MPDAGYQIELPNKGEDYLRDPFWEDLTTKPLTHFVRSVFFFSLLSFASKLAASSKKEKATSHCDGALL